MGKKRLAWPDVAKGVSILGVIVLHVCLAVPGGMDTLLARANSVMDPLRMPLFFLVSGFFSAKILDYSLTELFVRRLWFFLVPYAVWVPVEIKLKFIEFKLVFDADSVGADEILWRMLIGANLAWFLWALVLFNLVLWSLRKLPPPVAIAASFAPLLLLPWHDKIPIVGMLILYLPFFVGGLHLRGPISRFAATATSVTRWLPAAMGFFLGVMLVKLFAQVDPDRVALPWILPGMDVIGHYEAALLVRLSRELLSLPLAIVVAVAITHLPHLSNDLQFVGRHTLPMYIGHPIGMTLGYHLVRYALDDAGPQSTTFWLAYAILIALVSGWLFHLLSKVPVLGWTLTPPSLARPQPAVGTEAHAENRDHTLATAPPNAARTP